MPFSSLVPTKSNIDILWWMKEDYCKLRHTGLVALDAASLLEQIMQPTYMVCSHWSGEGDGIPIQYSAWKIPWMEEPGRLQSMGSLRVGHDWATSLYFSLSCIGEDNGNPLQCSCLENTRDGGAWWAAVSGVAQSRTWLKRRSSSSSSSSSHWSGECILFHPLSERRIRSGLYKCGLDHSTIYVII